MYTASDTAANRVRPEERIQVLAAEVQDEVRVVFDGGAGARRRP